MCVALSIWFLGGPCSGITKFDDCDAFVQMRDAIAAYDSMAKDEEVCTPTTHYRISHHPFNPLIKRAKGIHPRLDTIFLTHTPD